MKKLLIVVLAVLTLLTACSPKPGNDGENDSEMNNQLQDLKSYIEQSKQPDEVKEYLDQLMSGSDEKTSDSLIAEYLKYMGVILSDTVAYEKDVLENAGFKFISVEGDEQPVIDYHFIDQYSGQLSREMLAFTKFMALNSDDPWAMDAGIIIPLTELADRVALGEQFIVKYPDSLMKEQVLLQYTYYLRSLLAGLDNTPLVLYDSNSVDTGFIDAFNYFLETYPDLKTAETVASFLSELKSSGYAAPYAYGDFEKRDAFQNHIDELAADASSSISQ